jgi:hypothetical protein
MTADGKRATPWGCPYGATGGNNGNQWSQLMFIEHNGATIFTTRPHDVADAINRFFSSKSTGLI